MAPSNADLHHACDAGRLEGDRKDLRHFIVSFPQLRPVRFGFAGSASGTPEQIPTQDAMMK
jgi:hypothetical protein